MDVIKKVKGIFNKEETTETPSAKLEALMKEKEEATKNGEPWVAVLDTKINEDNIRNGFFELDWNNEFIEQLIDAGYQGEEPEQIVDQWFRTIAMQVLDDEGLDKERNIGYINTTKIDDNGKSEVK